MSDVARRWPGRRLLFAVPVALLLAQAIRPAHTNPPVEDEVTAPPEVREILRRACWDCHSNETVWGWHTYVAPASWLTVHDVKEGREDLNFSAWERSRRKEKLPQKIAEEVGEGDMPPFLYRLAHPRARLSKEERAALVDWARSLRSPGR
jgi:hypothetical protein